ncbi:hypothetical protein GUJ93_ZPchr0005g15386 [Zizania palustris]|uniref:Uncharacterized protein n=1 Tax=Zizania palustris TaxID=103762 RepID=A0A8J5T507_ZIZPA|nr:hypothetical protein GUJ93_ZPchr0005g15386 [Zizania palustris]
MVYPHFFRTPHLAWLLLPPEAVVPPLSNHRSHRPAAANAIPPDPQPLHVPFVPVAAVLPPWPSSHRIRSRTLFPSPQSPSGSHPTATVAVLLESSPFAVCSFLA